MKTPEEIRERYIHIAELNDIDKAEIEVAIQITQTEAWKEGAIEELTKAKSLTEHLNQQERNEYFETRLKKLAE